MYPREPTGTDSPFPSHPLPRYNARMAFTAGFRKRFLSEGDHKGVDPSRYDPEQFRKGMEEEKEHLRDPAVRAKITADHLAKQIKSKKKQNYYTELKRAGL